MKKLLALLILLSSFALAQTVTGNATLAVTSDPIDTTGASLIVVTCANYGSMPSGVMSNPYLGTPTPLPGYGDVPSNAGYLRQFYFVAPNPSTSQRFTCQISAGGTGYVTIAVSVITGTSTAADVLDGTSGSLTGQPGVITPTANGDVCIASYGSGNGEGIPADPNDDFSIDSGFTMDGTNSNGIKQDIGQAYIVQGNAAPLDPQWTSPDYPAQVTVMSCYKNANPPANSGGSGGGSTVSTPSYVPMSFIL
jgi:hypothetical protein